MKRKITNLLVIASMFAFGSSFAQDAYKEGGSQVNLGVGFITNFVTIPSGTGYTTHSIPPISASYEYGITDKISVGGYLGYTSTGWDYTYTTNDLTKAGFPKVDATSTTTYSYTIFGVRGSYHFATSDKLDPYAGAMLGYNVASVSWTTNDPNTGGINIAPVAASAVAFSAHLGARYFFTDNIGAFAEIGYGVAIANLGLTLKF